MKPLTPRGFLEFFALWATRPRARRGLATRAGTCGAVLAVLSLLGAAACSGSDTPSRPGGSPPQQQARGAPGSGHQGATSGEAPSRAGTLRVDLSTLVIEAPADTPRPPFTFSPEDEQFLDQVQRGVLNYMLAHASEHGMVPDRTSKPVITVAGLGFQLAAIPVFVERGWLPREQARDMTLRILRGLTARPEIRKEGLFQHFFDARTLGLHTAALEHVVSTIDSALLLGGVIVASQYFGGEIASIGDRLVHEANWRFFVDPSGARPHDRGFISLGWKPASLDDPNGPGELLPYRWIDAGCEHRLVTFLAVAAPNPDFTIPPRTYYRLRRQVGEYSTPHGSTGPFVWFPWSGALFVSQFSHMFLDYSAMGPDEPSRFEVVQRPRVDWWENSRRTNILHRLKALENPRGLATLGRDAWGLTASDYARGYLVAGVFPRLAEMVGAEPDRDYATYLPEDAWGDGTLAPYAAASAIMFEPTHALAALRHYRRLAQTTPGLERLWSDPATGGFGFADAFNLRGPDGTPWVAGEHLAIDHLPMVIAIENARSGLVWRLFHDHPIVKAGLERLGLERSRSIERTP